MDRPLLPTEVQVVDYNRLADLLEAAYKEIAELAKKRPDNDLGSVQLTMTNRILEPLQQILSLSVDPEFLPFLDPAEQPTYADAVFLLGQYLGAVGTFRGQFHFRPEDEHFERWVTAENPGRVVQTFDGGARQRQRR
jgi:hypothetical protein